MAPALRSFYAEQEHETYQHWHLKDTAYMPGALFVDVDDIADLMNPDFTEESIGKNYLEFANLTANLETDPGGHECYAHLAIHGQSTKVYLMEPSGDPKLIAESLDAFLAVLAPTARPLALA